jgi:hypothetical protein
MRYFLIGLAFGVVGFFAFDAFAQADIIERPTTALSTSKVQASASPNIDSTCLVLCGSDHLDPVNHFDCQPSSPDAITTHTVTLVNGTGNICIRAVVLNSALVVSEPSPNQKTILDVPFAPAITE